VLTKHILVLLMLQENQTGLDFEGLNWK